MYFKTLSSGAILFALTTILSVYLITSTIENMVLNKGRLTVKGYAERKIASDYAIWQGSVTTRASTLQEAYEKLEQDLILIMKDLNERDIKSEEVEVAAVTTTINYKRTNQSITTNEIDEYVLQRDFSVQTTNIELISKVADQITELIKNGIALTSYKPKYFYTKVDELKINLLGDAAKDALARAKQLATNSGSQVGYLRSAQQGVFQITPAFSTTISDYGENDTSTIEKSIKAVVTMEYGIK
jgi:hypothetical protein